MGATGGAQIAWAYRVTTGTGDGPVVRRFAFLLEGTDPRVGWSRPFGWGEVSGDIGATAVRGRRLHVLFADGTHRIYSPDQSTIGLKLPRPIVPIALAGDEQADALYAIVPRHVAATLLNGKPETETDSRPIPSNERASSAAANPVTDDMGLPLPSEWPETQYVLLRFADAQWHADRPMPAWFDQRRDVHLAAHGGTIDVISLDAGDGSRWFHARSSSRAAGWSERLVVGALSTANPVAVFVVGDAPVLVTVTNGSNESAYRAVRFDGEEWSVGRSFETLDGAPGGVCFAVLGDRVVAMWPGEGGSANWGAWTVDGGEPVVAHHSIGPLESGAALPGAAPIQTMVAYLVLAIIMLTVYVRRKQTVFRLIELPPGYRLARFGPRLYAFLIDAILFLPACVYGFSGPVQRFRYDQAVLWQAAINDPAFASELMWRWTAVVGGFVVYATVFETVWGATPGKRLMRCRVVNERAERCGLLRALVRNVVRSLEISLVTLLWTVMLVLLTRNRQRLGDLLGGTIVVELDEPPPSAPGAA